MKIDQIIKEDAEPIDREFALVKKLGRLGQRIVQNPQLWDRYDQAVNNDDTDWVIGLIQDGTGATAGEVLKLADLFGEIGGGLGRIIDFAWAVKEGTWDKDFMDPYRAHRSQDLAEGPDDSDDYYGLPQPYGDREEEDYMAQDIGVDVDDEAEDQHGLNEFAPADDNDSSGDPEDVLFRFAKMWYSAPDVATQQKVEQALAKIGWEIGELESEEGGAFVMRIGDDAGDSYIGWSEEDLADLDEAKKKKKSSRSLRGYFFPGYAYYGSGESGEGGGDGGGESINRGMAEGAGNVGNAIRALYQKIYAAGDDGIEYFYNDSPIFAQYWDEYEGDLDSIIAEVDPSELEVIKAELESYVDDANLTEAPGAETLAHNQSTVASNEKAFDLEEGNKKPEPPEADYGDDYQAMVARVKKLAGLGPLKTVYDPQKRVYKNVPTAVQPAQKK